MLIQWRDYLIGEIQDTLRKNHNFFEANAGIYESSPLKRIIARFEYILNSYLREFVKLSIDDWVEFTRSFTIPNLENGKLWKFQTTPMIVIHLSFKLKEAKKKDDKRKPKKKTEGEGEDDDANTINYHPKL
jgi:hypothetical protein